MTTVARPKDKSRSFASDEGRWQALVDRDAAADGAFYYSVRTTGVYCRPTCAARVPLRQNVRFHRTCREAELAGFRACKRCKPNESSIAQRQASIVAEACRMIENAETEPSLAELASAFGMSQRYFHRIFKDSTGTTPKRYKMAQLGRRLRQYLGMNPTVTDAILDAGFNSSGQFYRSSNELLGMTPTTYLAGGEGLSVRFAIGQCWLGSILVAASDLGICAILLGDDPEELARDVQDRFPNAELIGDDDDFAQLVATVVAFLEAPSTGLELPLDLYGTVFQIRVWDALRQIPAGSTASSPISPA